MPPLSLEDFCAQDARSAAPSFSETETEEIRQNAYENGFQAGAADAIAAIQTDESRLSAELVATLQDMSFGFHEASAHVVANVTPVLKAVLETVLPRLMSEIVGYTILEAVEPFIEEAAGIPVRLLVCPDEAQAIRMIIGESADVPFVIVEDQSLGHGRAHLKVGSVERQIDVTSVLDRISAAVEAATELNMRKIANG